MDPATADGGRFDAMRSMLRAIDELVLDHLARACPKRLGGLADRTRDAAEYPGRGSRFVRHVDNTGRDDRRLTVLCYLSPDYAGEHGGALKVYDADDADGSRGVEGGARGWDDRDVLTGRDAPRGVAERRSRLSFTVWYYDETEFKDAETRRGEAAATDSRAAHMPSVDGSGGSDPGATLAALGASDREAQAFVRRMMTQRLTPAAAAAAARGLGERALRTVATVFGAPDPASFVVALTQMSQAIPWTSCGSVRAWRWTAPQTPSSRRESLP